MPKRRASRLERWTRQVRETSVFVRALNDLAEDLTTLATTSRRLVIAIALVAVAVAGSIKLL